MALALVASASASACAGAGGAKATPAPLPEVTVGPDGILYLPDDPSRPYGITAIDYHFHDAHPTSPLQPDRTVTVRNVGRNVHNVTILGTEYSRDVSPGELLEIGAIGDLLPSPGRYRFVCAYHLDRGMTGTIVIAG